jgi:hypothetical protein
LLAAGSRYPATASEDVTMDTDVCVTVYCGVQSSAVSKSPMNPIASPNPLHSGIEAWNFVYFLNFLIYFLFYPDIV